MSNTSIDNVKFYNAPTMVDGSGNLVPRDDLG